VREKYQFLIEKVTSSSNFLFEQNFTWFKNLNINYHTGVDGISVAMILLTAFVVLAGILVSWNQEKLHKEFFFLLLLKRAMIFPIYVPCIVSGCETVILVFFISIFMVSFWDILIPVRQLGNLFF